MLSTSCYLLRNEANGFSYNELQNMNKPEIFNELNKYYVAIFVKNNMLQIKKT